MKFFLLTVSLLLFNSSTGGDVYICVSKTASKYHLSENCKGLKQCTHVVKKVSLKEANELGYKLCGWEK